MKHGVLPHIVAEGDAGRRPGELALTLRRAANQRAKTRVTWPNHPRRALATQVLEPGRDNIDWIETRNRRESATLLVTPWQLASPPTKVGAARATR
eukprot:1283088-Alexandrium_andersonii.AAC.1